MYITTLSTCISKQVKYHQMYKCQLYFPDPAVPGSLEEMKKIGLPTANFAKGEIMTGVQVMSDSRLFLVNAFNEH